jgi:hypothetical protein
MGQVQGIQKRSVQPYRLYPAGSGIAPQDAGVKTIPRFFPQYPEKVPGPLIPPGEGLPQLLGFKEDDVHGFVYVIALGWSRASNSEFENHCRKYEETVKTILKGGDFQKENDRYAWTGYLKADT